MTKFKLTINLNHVNEMYEIDDFIDEIYVNAGVHY